MVLPLRAVSGAGSCAIGPSTVTPWLARSPPAPVGRQSSPVQLPGLLRILNHTVKYLPWEKLIMIIIIIKNLPVQRKDQQGPTPA